MRINGGVLYPVTNRGNVQYDAFSSSAIRSIFEGREVDRKKMLSPVAVPAAFLLRWMGLLNEYHA